VTIKKSGWYKKKPIAIYAQQWYPGYEIDGVTITDRPEEGITGHIETLEGPMTVHPGSYIMTGIDDEKWAIKEDIFLRTYDVCEAPDDDKSNT